MGSRAEVIASLAPKYVWWTLDESGEARDRRVLAQIMDLGTYDDIRAIEAVFARDELVEVMAGAQPVLAKIMGFLARPTGALRP